MDMGKSTFLELYHLNFTNRLSKYTFFNVANELGGIRTPSPPRHDTTAPKEPFCARGSIRLSLFLYYELLIRTCLSGSSLISSLPFRLPGGFFPFWGLIREAHPSL